MAAAANAAPRARVLSVDIGRTHYALCYLDLDPAAAAKCGGGGGVQLTDLRLVQLGDSSAVPLTTLVDRMIDVLREYPPLAADAADDPDCVLIEQQMRAAPKNLALAFATYTYFRTRGVRVKMVRPSQKFEGWRHWCPALPSPAAASSYYQRKKASIQLAQAVLRHLDLPPLEQHVSAGHKLDDVADAFLQGLCYAAAAS